LLYEAAAQLVQAELQHVAQDVLCEGGGGGVEGRVGGWGGVESEDVRCKASHRHKTRQDVWRGVRGRRCERGSIDCRHAVQMRRA
jgi:hypothetical protein